MHGYTVCVLEVKTLGHCLKMLITKLSSVLSYQLILRALCVQTRKTSDLHGFTCSRGEGTLTLLENAKNPVILICLISPVVDSFI